MPHRVVQLFPVFLLTLFSAGAASGVITHDARSQRVTIADANGHLELRLNYRGRCLLDRVVVRGQSVVPEATGVCSAIKVTNQWFSTRAGLASPEVKLSSNSVTVSGIRFGGGGVQVAETWQFTMHADRIVWRIDRTYLSGGTLDDTYFPGWGFNSMSTWTGALLGHGGVAWGKLFDAPNTSYGVHNGTVTFWNKDSRACLRIVPRTAPGAHVAVRFSRQPSDVFSFNYSLTERELVPKHGLSRFRRDRQDIWRPFEVSPSGVSVEYTLEALDYDQAYDLGVIKSLDGAAVREIRHTIARIGAVDERIHGSNGYYSDCAVLHEPWLAQLGLLIDDPAYTRAFADTLDFQREHAIGPDGRVKSRWAGTAGDAMPGTYDAFGFYEAQWGYLLDSQPSWVINIAELFDLTGDQTWLARQKSACERVLDYLLRRDADGDGLVEMLTDSHRQAKGSDWIDVVWASYENALVNAQMYQAMTLWANLEDLLGDQARADRYRTAAGKLKRRFNQTTAEGGFWDAQNQCYAYWRDQDDSIHGTNLVVPVNFSAIGYGLCDDPGRGAAILNRIESLMQRERLFFWPLCFFSYMPGEAHPSQYPFATYENGDLFLAWGELGTRAYAVQDPAVALKYVKNVLAQYARDGLAFQRYLRQTQTGAGNDILANNCSIVVGLYRNLYGIQPRHNRLFLEPHLVPELNGTRLKYSLRGQSYLIDLSTEGCQMTVEDFAVRATQPFALKASGNRAEYFSGGSEAGALSVTRSKRTPLELRIEAWPDGPTAPRRWTEVCARSSATLRYVISGLRPGTPYQLLEAGTRKASFRADASGHIEIEHNAEFAAPRQFEIVGQP